MYLKKTVTIAEFVLEIGKFLSDLTPHSLFIKDIFRKKCISQSFVCVPLTCSDGDSDCQGTMRCAQRSGTETVPGCSFDRDLYKRKDFCFEVQIVEDNVINYVGECDPSTYLCDVCEGDCDNDDDCSGDLICRQRRGFEEVPGCIGEGGSTDVFKKDICMRPETANPTSSPTIVITPAPTSSPFSIISPAVIVYTKSSSSGAALCSPLLSKTGCFLENYLRKPH